MAVTGIRFPDEMVDISTLALDDKVLVADESDSKKAKWFKVEELSQFLTSTNTVGIKSTVDNFVLTAAQSISETITLTLRNAIAENSFVLVTTENDFGGALDSKKISYTAGESEVTIENDLYFDFEEGDEIAVYYFYGIGNETPAELPVTLDSFSSLAGINSIQYSFTLSNPNDYDINTHVNLCFNDGAIQEVVIKVTANSSKTYTKTYNSLLAGSYALVLSGDVAGTETATISEPLAPEYVYSNFNVSQNINNETVSIDVTNTGDMAGMAGCYFKLDSEAEIHKGLNPIAIGQKITFQHTFTGLSSGSHTIYAYEEDGITLIDSSIITIPIIAQPATVYCAENWDVIATKEKNSLMNTWSPYTLKSSPTNNNDYIGTDLNTGKIKQGRQLLKFNTTGVLNCVTAKIKMLVKILDFTGWSQSYFDIYESTCIDNTNFEQVWNNINPTGLLSSVSTELNPNFYGYYVVVFTLNASGISLINTGVPVKLLMIDISELKGFPATKYVNLPPATSYNPRLILTY